MSSELDTTTTATYAAIAEVQQSRSRFQLERFVVGQFDTPEMRFMQICIELQQAEFNLAHATLTCKKSALEVAGLRATGDAIDAVQADIQELETRQTQLAMIGAQREVDILREMFAESPKYTREQIEQAQPEYWNARLTRQFDLQQATGSVGWAQLDAMLQAGIMHRDAQGQIRRSASPNEIAS